MKISKFEFKQRVKTTQRVLKNHKVEALIVSQEEDIYYLTDFQKSRTLIFINN
jgi:Xaa-Pro aminopeptidase